MAIQIHYWSPNVEQQLRHYVDVLAFELAHRQPADPPADFCILKFDDAQIMIGSNPATLASLGRNDRGILEEVTPRVGRPGPISVYIGVNEIDAYQARVAAGGAEIVEPLWDSPWGTRQFSVRDPDGNLTTFFLQ